MATSLIELTADVVASYVGRNSVSAGDLADLIKSVYVALSGEPEDTPAPGGPVALLTKAQIRRSFTPDAIFSFEDGRPYKSLKRHLAGRGISPAEYRAKWGLPKDYAMVSATYSAARSELAKAMGLGKKAAAAMPVAEPPTAPATSRSRPSRGNRALRRPRPV